MPLVACLNETVTEMISWLLQKNILSLDQYAMKENYSQYCSWEEYFVWKSESSGFYDDTFSQRSSLQVQTRFSRLNHCRFCKIFILYRFLITSNDPAFSLEIPKILRRDLDENLVLLKYSKDSS